MDQNWLEKEYDAELYENSLAAGKKVFSLTIFHYPEKYFWYAFYCSSWLVEQILLALSLKDNDEMKVMFVFKHRDQKPFGNNLYIYI